MHSIGERIKIIREWHGWNQKELAALIGVSVSAISRCEGGSTGMSDTVKTKLRKISGVSLDWLITGEGEMFPPPCNTQDTPRENRKLSPDRLVTILKKLVLADSDTCLFIETLLDQMPDEKRRERLWSFLENDKK